MTTSNAATTTEEDEPEADAMITTPCVQLNNVLNESELRQTDFSLQQDDSTDDDNRDVRHRAEETSIMHLPESTPFSRECPSTEYSFVGDSGILRPVPVEEGQNQMDPSSPEHAVATMQGIGAVTEVTQTATTIPEAEVYDEESGAVIVQTAEGEGDETIAPAFVSAERVANDFTQPATVVSTVDDCSDDAIIRKILQEDLIASGRSTDELQRYIQTASLENVASRMSRAAEEEKTEIVEPDTALAWALHENEVLSSMSNMFAENEQQNVAVATIPEEEATVVGITDDVHPAERTSDARAELIGEDYSVNYLGSRDTIDTPSPSTRTATAFAAVDEEMAAEATVLDSKPAATVAANPWSENVTEEATVLETKLPADESWSRADDEAREMTVEAVAEEEGLVLGITEDVHPAEFLDHEAEATFIGRADYASTVAVDAVAEEGPRMVHFIEETMAPATPIESGHARAVSYSTPPAQRPHAAARAVSEPPRNPVASPVDYVTSDSFDRGIAALDAHEQSTWMNRPSCFQFGDEVLMPPPSQSTAAPAPMAAAQVLNERSGSNCSDVPPLPPRTAAAERNQRTSSTQTQESERSSGTTGSGRRAAASLQLVRSPTSYRNENYF